MLIQEKWSKEKSRNPEFLVKAPWKQPAIWELVHPRDFCRIQFFSDSIQLELVPKIKKSSDIWIPRSWVASTEPPQKR